MYKLSFKKLVLSSVLISGFLLYIFYSLSFVLCFPGDDFMACNSDRLNLHHPSSQVPQRERQFISKVTLPPGA